MSSFSGRTAIVTGGARGIGEASVRSLAEAGASVAVVDIDREGAERVAGSLATSAIALGCDVADPDQVERMVTATVQEFGRLDILHSNVAASSLTEFDGNAVETSIENWDETLSVNLKGAFLCTRFAVPEMLRSGGGSIIITSSTAAAAAMPGLVAYTSSKGGLEALTRHIAVAWAAQGIRCNAVAPGFVDTHGGPGDLEDLPTRMSQFVPMGRPGRPEDIANVVRFLASDDSAYMTGQVLAVDGGLRTYIPGWL